MIIVRVWRERPGDEAIVYSIVEMCLDSPVHMLYDVESPGTRAEEAASDYAGGHQESPATHCTANQTHHQSAGMYLQVIHSTRVLLWHAILLFYYILHANVLYLPGGFHVGDTIFVYEQESLRLCI